MKRRSFLALAATGIASLAVPFTRSKSAALQEILPPPSELGVGIQGGNTWNEVKAFDALIAPAHTSIVRRYRMWSDTMFDDAARSAIAAGKKCLFVPHAFEADSDTNPSTSIRWADIAARKYDTRLRKWAQEFKDAGYPPSYLVFHHEMEDDCDDTYVAGKTGQGRCGTIPEFVAAFTHFYHLMRNFGVPTAIPIGVCLMGGTFRSKHRNPADYIPVTMPHDLILSDGYSRNEKSGQAPKTFVDTFGAAHDFAVSRGKPFAIEEWGVSELATDPNFKADHFTNAVPYLQAWKPEFVEYSEVYADNFGGQDYRINTSPQSLAAFQALANAAPFN